MSTLHTEEMKTSDKLLELFFLPPEAAAYSSKFDA
jgi:hypothetical protein